MVDVGDDREVADAVDGLHGALLSIAWRRVEQRTLAHRSERQKSGNSQEPAILTRTANDGAGRRTRPPPAPQNCTRRPAQRENRWRSGATNYATSCRRLGQNRTISCYNLRNRTLSRGARPL